MDGELFKPEFYGLQEIVNFRASLNNFRGTIPTEIGQWTKLQNLWFAQNFITGTLPTEIGNCIDMGECVPPSGYNRAASHSHALRKLQINSFSLTDFMITVNSSK